MTAGGVVAHGRFVGWDGGAEKAVVDIGPDSG
jgi:hypothetical protein